MLDIALVALSRALLVLLFLPVSALDKLLNFRDANAQAALALGEGALSRVAILAGLLIEILASACILSGVADRVAAMVLAVYCTATALLWKRFWRSGDFSLQGLSRGRDTFWDFLKNFALAGGFLTLTFGGTAVGVKEFLQHPFESSHPYRAAEPARLTDSAAVARP